MCTKRCDADGESCQALASGATCETCAGEAVCDRLCTGDADCAALGGSFACSAGRCREVITSVTGGGVRCPVDYTPIVGRPVNDCVEVAPDPVPAAWTVGCLPAGNYAQVVTRCYRRVADGTAWLVPAWGVIENSDEWAECTANQRAASLFGCNFAACEHPPPSSCSTAETCKQVGCGGFEFDESGCARPDCDGDEDCPGDQRCATVGCSFGSSCTAEPGGPCLCSGVLACIPRSHCTDVTQTGPRGDWVELQVTRTNYECGDDPRCSSWYRVAADGGVAAVRDGQPISSALSPADLGELRALIDGPELRAALRDGLDCGWEVQDADVVMRLTLSTGALERDVAGCVEPRDVESIFKQVDAIARRH